MRGGTLGVLAIALLLIVPASLLTSSGDAGNQPVIGLSSPDAPTHLETHSRAEPGLLENLEPVNHVIVRFHETVDDALLDRLDLDVPYRFESLPAVYTIAPAPAVETLASAPGVAHVEKADKPIDFDLDTATLATLAREVWDPAADNPHVPGNPDPIEVNGETIDGAGVGIAVIDSGIDWTHPDLPREDKVKRSFLATGTGVVEAPYFSPQVPHGTAVAGVAGGTGQASGGTLAGAAPGSGLYSFSVHQATVDGLSGVAFRVPGGTHEPITLYPAVAMDWIAEHGDEQDPPIKVVNNAWHCRYAECRATVGPDSIHAQLAQELVDEGIAVTWAYGNTEFTWNPEATLPIQGVMGVTSTTDIDAGFRDGCKSDFASSGYPLDPSTWPDLAAPGESIETTNSINVAYQAINPTTTRVPVADEYRVFSGTSLAAAHVAGVASMLLQANPDLTPGEVEWILEDTATKPPEDVCVAPYNKGDPTHPTRGANYEVGHGLIDAHAAVQTAIGFTGIPDTDGTAIEPNDDFLEPDDLNDLDAVEVDQRLYLAGTDTFSLSRPTGASSQSVQANANEEVTFTSAPFDGAREITGIDASVWVDVDNERVSQWDFFTNADLLLRVEQVGSGGELKDAITLATPWRTQPVQAPLERPFVQAFDTPIAIDAGDRVRATITVQSDGLAGPDTAPTTFEVFWGSADHPSHLGLGERAPDAPGTYRDCRGLAPHGCGWMGVDHPSAQVSFDGGHYELRWEGPGGSGAEMLLHGVSRQQCEVPEDEAWGSCAFRVHDTILGGVMGATQCRVLDQGAPIQGHGTCRILDDI